MAWSERVVTPEAVVLEREIAGPGSRFIGALMDLLVQGGLVMLALGASVVLPPGGSVVIVSSAVFVAMFVYPTVTETLSRGRTLGKVVAKTRVIRTDGRPVTFAVVLVRNLVRILDWLPSFYVVGAVTAIVTRRTQRLGDLAAGTLVVYDVRATLPEALHVEPQADALRMTAAMDAGGLSAEEYHLVRSFLQRRYTLEPAARQRLGADLAARLRHIVAGPDGGPPEAFLEAVAASYRERHAR